MFRGINIFQVFVPLTFLAIWALTSLFNREAQPLPPRTGRPPGPPGPRPGGPMPSTRPMDRRPESYSRDPSARWSPSPGSTRPPAGRPGGRPDDEIVIIESETRRTPPPRPEPPASTRRAARPRSSTPPASKRQQEVPTTRALSASIGQDATSQANRPLEFSALTKMTAPLSAPVTQEVAAAAHQAPKSASLACLTSGEIQALINSPAKLREAIVISEILRPPLALRRDRRGDF